MHTITAKAQRTTTTFAIVKTPMGHQPHYSGTGVHHDKRTRRCRTRAAIRQRAVGDQ